MMAGIWVQMFLRNFSLPSSRHFDESGIQVQMFWGKFALRTLKIEADTSPETTVSVSQPTLCNIP